MAGVWVTDPTSGPGQAEEWPQEIIDLTETPRVVFPRPLPPQQIVGGLLPEAAQWLDLPPGTPVAVGMHDGASSSIGAQAADVGDVCLTLGTNFVLRAVTGERLRSRSFSYLVLADRWAWVNNVYKASAQLDMVANLLGGSPQPEARVLHPVLGAAAADVAPGCDGLVIERMLAGQEAAGQEEAFLARLAQAQQAGHSNGHIYRAVMEALARGVLDLL
jgi:sugar (pentulose or hexulose) kinase